MISIPIRKKYCLHAVAAIFTGWLLFACKEATYSPEDFKVYEGPIGEVINLNGQLSDSGRVKAKMSAPLQLRYANGNEAFPKGFTLNTFDRNENKESTIFCDSAYFEKELNQWELFGNVNLENLQQSKSMKTEELHWSPDKEKVWTDKYVIIKSPDQTLHGKGLQAKDDFSEYEILEPHGSLQMQVE